jgi:hypothetical protein
MCGIYSQYTAGVFNEFEGAVLFITLNDTPILKAIFQRHYDYIEQFNINEFKFLLIGVKPGYDVFQYVVSCENFSTIFLIIGIAKSRLFNRLSNVDFVHFIWENYRRFNFK